MREGDDELLRRTSVRSVDLLDAASVSGELKIPIEAGVATRESFVDIGPHPVRQLPPTDGRG